MIVALIADTHITERAGESGMTLAEQVELLKWIGDDAKEHGAELLLHAGDVFDGTTTPAERNAAIEVFLGWADLMPVLVVQGNHDRPGDLNFLGHLSGISIFVTANPYIYPVDDAAVACLPWPRKANLVAAMGSTSGTDVQEAAGSALRAILAGFRVAFEKATGPTILLAHAELGGAQLDNGQPVAGRCDVALHEHDLLETGADAILLGHIHKHQILSERIVYAGAPRPTRFGEEGAKGYCLVDVEKGRAPVIKHRKAPYREMVTIDLHWDICDGDKPMVSLPLDCWKPGDALRLRWTADEAERKQASEYATGHKRTLLEHGAHSVKLDPRITTTHRVRSEAIAEAQTTEDKLHAWWEAHVMEPEVERAKRILAKLQTLESEVL